MDVFALVYMWPQLVVVGFFFLLCLLAIIALRPKGSRGWALTAVAFSGAITIATIWWAIYVFTSDDYVNNEERFEDLWPFLTIGGMVGTAVALGVVVINLIGALGRAASNLRKTSTPDHVAAHKHSIKHREEIIRSKQCGCFHCLAIFKPSAITDWTDEDDADIGTTALCPKCGIDSVIASASGYPITAEFLGEMKTYWFIEKKDHPALS